VIYSGGYEPCLATLNPNLRRAVLRVAHGGLRDLRGCFLSQFKTHPNIDKALHARENILGLKDPNRPFPTGSPLGVLKWRMQATDESMVPLSINCWPSTSGDESYVALEYEATSDFELQNVVITVPLPALRDPPTVNQVRACAQ
jgi:hypothetical protein